MAPTIPERPFTDWFLGAHGAKFMARMNVFALVFALLPGLVLLVGMPSLPHIIHIKMIIATFVWIAGMHIHLWASRKYVKLRVAEINLHMNHGLGQICRGLSAKEMEGVHRRMLELTRNFNVK